MRFAPPPLRGAGSGRTNLEFGIAAPMKTGVRFRLVSTETSPHVPCPLACRLARGARRVPVLRTGVVHWSGEASGETASQTRCQMVDGACAPPCCAGQLDG
jgi:hypothetical protein